MREYEPTTQEMLLNWLRDVVNEKPNPTREVELWRVRKGDRELACLAVYLPTGIDVRLMEGDGFRRTQLVRDAGECTALSDDWKLKLVERGWDTAAPLTE